MKKVILLITLLFGTFVYAQFPNPQESVRLYDYADILTNEEKIIIEKKLQNYEIQTSIQFSIVIIESMRDYGGRRSGDPGSNARFRNLENLSLNWANQWGVGEAEKNNGVFYIFSLKDRVHNLRTGSGLNELMTSSDANYICKSHVRNYKFKNYFDGMNGIVDDVINQLGSETANERYEKISLIKKENQRIAEQKAEQARLNAIESEKRRKERVEAWSKTWPKILEWLLYAGLLVLSFFSFSYFRDRSKKKKEMKSTIDYFNRAQLKLQDSIAKLSSLGMPTWSVSVFKERSTELENYFSHYKQMLIELRQVSYKQFNMFTRREKSLRHKFNSIENLIKYINVDLPMRVKKYEDNAQVELNSLKELISSGNSEIRKISRSTDILFPLALDALGDINSFTKELKIDSRDKDSYKLVYDSVQEKKDELEQIMKEVIIVDEKVSKIKNSLPNLRHTFDYIESNSQVTLKKYDNLISSNRGELINNLSESRIIFDLVLNGFEERYQKIYNFSLNPSDKSLKELNYSYFNSLCTDVEVASNFEANISSTKEAIEDAKANFEVKINEAEEALEKARKKVKKSYSGSKSKRSLEEAESKLTRLKQEQGMDIIDWILVIYMADSLINDSNTAYSQATSAINSHNSYSSSSYSSSSSSSGGGFSGGFGGGSFSGGSSGGGGW